MKQNEVEMVLEPSTVKPKVSDGTVVARPTMVTPDTDTNGIKGGFRKHKVANVAKVFCAPRDIAMALLEDFIIMAGAHNDVMEGKATETQIVQVSTNTQKFMIDLSDRLMVDCGLTENDINTIVSKLGEKVKNTPVEQP